ncbi:Imm8 family immunity protein [Halobacteriovorax sp.]|uniref:Imm8 family immunity protein n=1 Tax=Halobacteriovorax sp. TaxID=2020862 RepID=UPI0035685518
MKSEIKQILAESEEFNLDFCPEDAYNFHFILRIMIGRHKIIMKEYNYKSLRNRVLKLFGSKDSDNWKNITEYLSRYAYWEFEDYKE